MRCAEIFEQASRPLVLTLVLLLGAFAPLLNAAGSASKPLFLSNPQPAMVNTAPPDPLVVRSRQVALNSALMGSPAPVTQPNTRFDLNLFPDTSFPAVVIRSESPEPGRWTAYGVLEGVPQSQFLLTCNNGVLAGSVFVPGRGHFKLESRGSTDCVVTEVNHVLSGRCAACSGLAADSLDISPPSSAIRLLSIPPERPPVTNIVSLVDIMVVYTPAALAGAGSTNAMNSLIDLALAEANTVYQNSDIFIRFRLAYRGMVNYAEFPSLATNLNRLSTNGDGYLDEVHGLRQANQADLVCLITETGDPGFAGLAFTPIDSPPLASFAKKAFSVVQRSQAVATFTFVHEISHNLGCAHDRQHALDSTGTNLVHGSYSYSYGYRFTAGGLTYRDVMSYEPGIQIPYLSNPNLAFQGVPAGIPVGTNFEADNALTINLNAQLASALMGLLPTLTLPPLITLTAPASSVITSSGTNLTITATALDGDGPVKQVEFYADFTFLGAVTSPPYTLTWSNLPAGEFRLTARAVDSQGASAAALPVSLIVRPNDDNFASSVVVTGSAWQVSGSNRSATREAGEPLHSNNSGSNSVWYQWTAPKAGTVNLSAEAAGFTPLLGVYTGLSLTQLTSVISSVSLTNNSGLASFDVQAGGVYRIAFDGFSGGMGAYSLALAYKGPPANDDIVNRQIITGVEASLRANNLFATQEPGETNKYAFNTAGKSVWFSWTAPRNGPVIVTTATTNFLALPDIFIGTSVTGLTLGDTNRGLAFDNTNFVCTLTFEAVSNQTYSLVVAGFSSTSGWFDLDLLMPPAPGNDSFADRVPQFGTAWNLTGNNQFGTTEPGEPRPDSNTGGRSIWYSWTAPRRGTVILTATTTNFLALADVYIGTNVAQLTIASGRSYTFDQTNHVTTVTFEAIPDQVYAIAVAGFAGASGPLTLDLVMPSPPANDDFANRITETGTSWALTAVNVNASLETGEPQHAFQNSYGNSVWYSWTAPVSGPVVLTAIKPLDSPLVDVYTGDSVGSLTRVDGNFSFTNYLVAGKRQFQWTRPFTAVYNRTYVIALAGISTSSGTNSLSLVAGNVPPSIQLPVTLTSGQTNFSFRVNGSVGTRFLVQSTTNLVQWSNLATNIFSTDSFTVVVTNQLPYRFFRIFPFP